MNGYSAELILGFVAVSLVGVTLGLIIAVAIVRRTRRETRQEGSRQEAVNLRLEAERTRLESEKTRRQTEEMSRQIAQIRLDTMRRDSSGGAPSGAEEGDF